MNTGIDELLDGMEEKYGNLRELSPRGVLKIGFEELVEQELPQLEEDLKRYEGKRFTTLGKIEFLEEIREEVNQE